MVVVDGLGLGLGLWRGGGNVMVVGNGIKNNKE
jgi:hypothetical protein